MFISIFSCANTLALVKLHGLKSFSVEVKPIFKFKLNAKEVKVGVGEQLGDVKRARVKYVYVCDFSA